jgi:hypothetical protein
MLQLTKDQEQDLANRYWILNQKPNQILTLKEYEGLTGPKFYRVIYKLCPYDVKFKEHKNKKIKYIDWLNKADDNSTYVDHLTDEQLVEFNARMSS